MSLSCSCDYDDDCDLDWYWWPPKKYATFNRMVGKRCACTGCNHMIRYGQTVGHIGRTRPGTLWEEEHGFCNEGDPEAYTLASAYMCEKCTDLFFSFQDLGFECVSPYGDMRELAKQYHETYQPQEKQNATNLD